MNPTLNKQSIFRNRNRIWIVGYGQQSSKSRIWLGKNGFRVWSGIWLGLLDFYWILGRVCPGFDVVVVEPVLGWFWPLGNLVCACGLWVGSDLNCFYAHLYYENKHVGWFSISSVWNFEWVGLAEYAEVNMFHRRTGDGETGLYANFFMHCTINHSCL